MYLINRNHCVERVRIRSYSGPHFFPHFSAFGLFIFSPNAGKCRKNADQNNSKYGHFLRSGHYYSFLINLRKKSQIRK